MRRPSIIVVAVSSVAIVLYALVLSTQSAFAFDWPADGGHFRFGFGSWRGGFLRGVEFGDADGLVRASEDGELVFATEGSRLPGGYPLAGGSLLVIAHASEMTTVYSGMTSGSISTYLKNVRRGDVLGRTAEARSGRGAVVYAFDARERRFINPIIIMPNLSDDKPPVIKSITLSSAGTEAALDQPKSIRQGTYEMLIDSYDTSPAGIPGAPYDIRVLIDGSERAHVVYDAAWATGGRSVLFGGAGIGETAYLTDDGRMRFGPYTFSRGRVVVTVIVSDFSGNKREQTYSISVQ